MNKPPSQFYFETTSSPTLSVQMYKDHGLELYPVSKLKEIFQSLDGKSYVKINFDYDRDMNIAVLTRVEYPKAIFEQMTNAYHLEQKLKTTKQNLQKARDFLASLKSSDYSEELKAAKEKLNEIANNNKIPLEKRASIIDKLNNKIANLEAKHVGMGKEIAVELKEKIKSLEAESKLQQEIVNLKYDTYKEETLYDNDCDCI